MNVERTPTIRVGTLHLAGVLVRPEAELSLASETESVVAAEDVVGEWGSHEG